MAQGQPVTTITGSLGEDPSLRFTPSGVAVANLSVAMTPRDFDKQANEWRDGTTLWMRVTVWRQQAENVAESLQKGDRVVVTGRLEQQEWTDRESGQKRTTIAMQADEVGVSLLFATARADRNQSRGSSQGGSGASQRSSGGQPQSDPWASQAPAGDPWGAPSDEPPW